MQSQGLAFISGRTAEHGGWEPAARVTASPTHPQSAPSLAQERPPAQTRKNMPPVSSALTTCHLGLLSPEDTGPVLAGQLPSTDSSGLLLALEVSYSTFCDTGTGGTVVLPARYLIGLRPEALY